MLDHDSDLNLSVWNPVGQGRKAMDKDTEPEPEKNEEKDTKK